MAIPQSNIDGAIRQIRLALAPGADGNTLHKALDLLTSEEESSAPPAPQEGTSFMGNTHQPTTGVDNPDPDAPPFMGTTGGNANAIAAAKAADGEAPVNDPVQHELGSADPGAANMNLVGGGAGTAGAEENTPASGDLSAGAAGGAADGSSTFAPQGTTDGSPLPATGTEQAAQLDTEANQQQPSSSQNQDAQQQQPAPNQDQLNDAVAGGASLGGGGLPTNQDSQGQPTDQGSNGQEAQPNLARKEGREGVLDGNVESVKAAIKTGSVSELKKLREDEVNGKTRQGVLDAIDAQLEKLGNS